MYFVKLLGRSKDKKRNEEEADGARGNRGRLQITKCCKSVINNILGDFSDECSDDFGKRRGHAVIATGSPPPNK
jgi:hypothetical protein